MQVRSFVTAAVLTATVATLAGCGIVPEPQERAAKDGGIGSGWMHRTTTPSGLYCDTHHTFGSRHGSVQVDCDFASFTRPESWEGHTGTMESAAIADDDGTLEIVRYNDGHLCVVATQSYASAGMVCDYITEPGGADATPDA